MTLHYFGDLEVLRGKKCERKEDISPRGWRQISMFEELAAEKNREKKNANMDNMSQEKQKHSLSWMSGPSTGNTEGTPGHTATAPLPSDSGRRNSCNPRQRPEVSTQEWLRTPLAHPGLPLPPEELDTIVIDIPTSDDCSAKPLLVEQCKHIGMPFPADVAARVRQEAFQVLRDAVAARASA